MRVVQASLEPLRLVLRRPLKTGRATYGAREGWLLRLVDEQGHQGWGEAMPLPEFGTESTEACGQCLRTWLQALQRTPLEEGVEALSALLGPAPWEADQGEPLPAARHALELALLDLLARRRGVPLCRLLAPEPRAEVEVNALLGAEAPQALAEEARRAVAEGYRTLKVKVAGRPGEEDEARLEALRQAVGREVKLRVDANGAWEAAEAEQVLGRLERLGLELCEQPVPAERLSDWGYLKSRVSCPLAADEALAVPGAVQALVEERRVVDVLVLKPMVLGGVLPALRLARRAWARGVESYVTSALDGVVARAGATHLAAALPSGRHASGLGVGHLFVEEPAEHPFRPVQGRIRLLEAPGLGWAGAP
jgi:L-Ala-D/L-Glu epimerase